MSNDKARKISTILTAILIVVLSAVMLAACDGSLQSVHTLTLDYNDGREPISFEYDVQKGLEQIESPSRTGYTFNGWTTDREGTHNVTLEDIVNGITLYAQWTKRSYTVRFYIEEQIVKTQSVLYGDAATAPTDEDIAERLPAGHHFVDWDKPFNNVAGNLDVHANISPDQCKATFSDGQQIREYEGRFGAVIPTPPPVQKQGFEFVGWFNGDDKFNDGDTFKGDVNYTAKWQLATPTVSISGMQSLTYGDDIALTIAQAPEIDGITYSYEWLENNENIAYSPALNIASPIVGTRTFTAKVTARAQGYEDASASMPYIVRIAKKRLSASVDDVHLTYGDALGDVNIVYDGLENGDSGNVVSGARIDTNYYAGAAIGSNYKATITGFTADNYDFEENYAVVFNISVTKKNASFTVTASKVYDGTPYSVRINDNVQGISEGLLDGHSVSLAFATDSADANTYEGIIPTASMVSDAEGNNVTNNYSLTFNITITIDKATITQEIPSSTVFTYDGQSHTIPLELNEGLSVTYVVNGKDQSEAPSYINVGNYTVTFRFERANYNSLEKEAELVISPAQVTVRARAQSTTYGNDFALDQSAYDIEGDLYGNEISVVLSTDYSAGDTASRAYTITAKATLNDNFNIIEQSAVLTVYKAQIKVKAPSADVTYGETLDLAELEASFEDIPAHGAIPEVALSTTYTVGNGVDGSYEIIASLTSDDYDITFEKGVVTVLQREVTYTVDDATVVYGDEFDATKHTYKRTSGTLYGEDEITLVVSTDYEAGLNAAQTTALTAHAIADYHNYRIVIINGTLTVTKRPVTAKVDDKSVMYGEAAPEFSYQVTLGNFYGDAPVAKYATAYKPGDYESATIEVSFDDANHDITCLDGALEVTARALTLSISSTHAQDGKVWSVDAASLSANGLFTGDKLRGTLATAKSDNGSYTATGELGENFVWQAALKIENEPGYDVTNMYVVTYSLNIVIENEPIEYTLSDSRTHVYDGNAHGVTLSVNNVDRYTVMYSVNGEHETEVAPTFIDYGTYSVTFTLSCEGKTDTQGSYTYTVTKRNATLTAKSFDITFGDEKPQLDYDQSNVLENDIRSLEIALSCDYARNSNVGDYPVTLTFTENDNYQINAVSGNVHVNAKAVTLTLQTSLELAYGDNAPELLFTLSDEAAKAGISLTHNYAAGNSVGEYPITVNNSNDNYAVTAAAKYKFNVIAKAVDVKINNVTVTYGDTPTYSYTAQLYGDDTLEIEYECNDSKNVGEHTITATVTPNANYKFNVQNGTLTIQKATLIVNVAQIELTYGDPTPAEFTVASADGLKYDESKDDVLKGALSATSDYDVTTGANTLVEFNFDGLSADNYDIVYAAYSVTVSKAILKVELREHANVTYGDDAPEDYAFDITGFKNGDYAESIGLTITVNGTYSKDNPVVPDGYQYSLQANSTDFDNYTVVLGEAKTLTVDKANYDRATVLALLTDMPYSVTYVPEATVSTITLPDNFTWSNTDDKLVCSINKYTAWYNADPTNYNDVDNIEVTVNVSKATTTISSIKLTDNTLEKDWTGESFDIVNAFDFSLPSNYDGGKTLICTIDNSDDFNLYLGGVYKVHVSVEESDNWTSAQADYILKIKAAKIGDTTHTIEDALATATSGTTVTVFGNATISSDVEIKSGVTLLLPYDRVKGENSTLGDGKGADAINDPDLCKLIVTLKANRTITNNGTIIIGGITTGAQRPTLGGSGATAGDYAKLVLGSNAGITSNGNITSYGFIVEETQNNNSFVTMETGTLKMPFIVIEHRGGSVFYAMLETDMFGAITGKNNLKTTPFNRFYLQNVSAFLTVKSTASLVGHANLYASSKDNTTDIDLVGAENKNLIQLSSGSYLTAKYNITNKVTDLDTFGNVTLNPLKLTLSVGILSVSLSTEKVLFPLSWYYNVTLNRLNEESTTVTFNQDIKIMPGGKLTIGKGVTVNAQQIMVTDKTYKTFATGSSVYDSVEENGQLIINGTLTCTNIGGNVLSTETNGAKITCTGNSVTTYEAKGYTGSQFNTKITEYETITYSLTNVDGTQLEAGSYIYNGTIWESQ